MPEMAGCPQQHGAHAGGQSTKVTLDASQLNPVNPSGTLPVSGEVCTADGCTSASGAVIPVVSQADAVAEMQKSRIGTSLGTKTFVAEANLDDAVVGKGVNAVTPSGPVTTQPVNILEPTVPCKSYPGQKCYPPAQLAQISGEIGKGWEDLTEVADEVIPKPSKSQANDVRAQDLSQIFRYLNGDQDQIDLVKKVSGKTWAEIKEKPERLRPIIASADPATRKAIREGWQELKQQHDSIMNGGSPFHEPLMAAKDTFSERMMRAAGEGSGGGSGMNGGQWAGAQPDNSAANTYAANEALQNGNAAAAAEWARKALKLDPQDSAAHTALAAAQYDLKNYPDAASEAQKALELNPNDAKASAVLSLAHSTQLGKVPQAGAGDRPAFSASEAPWRKLPAADSQLASARDAARRAERLLSAGDYAAARAAADRALGIYPHSSYAYGLRSMANLKDGKAEDALKDAMAGLALNANDKLAQKARAQALLKLGRNAEALLAARAAVSGDPRSGYARFLLAEAREANGDRKGALEALRQAAHLDTRYQEIYEAALKTAEDGDMAFLFPDIKSGSLKSSAAAGSSRGARFAGIAAGALAAGGLLAFVLWKLLGATLMPALKTMFTRRGAAAPSSASSARQPSLLRGQYKTLRQIGVGGMGLVYEGSDESLNRKVAIKKMRDELRLDQRQRERFVTEARVVAALHHPSIVDIYAIVDESDELCLIFEYVAGQTMYEAIQRRGALPFGEAVGLFRGVSAALEYAHSRGIIHRDLKPSNIMINEEGRPKVMDFGIARAAKDALTRYSMTNTVVGTPPYMAPEQEQGVVRKESDVYALAICFYEAVTGKLPFVGSGGSMLMNKINKAYTPASKHVAGLPEGLDEVFAKAFEPDPDKRYRSIAELRAALEALPVAQAA